MSNDTEQSGPQLLGKLREDILKRQLSNTENYDKAVLTLGTTFLGFSVAFVKDFSGATLSFMLPTSWVLFGLSIVVTILSFFASQVGLQKQLYFAEKYYLEGDSSFFNKENIWARITNYLNYSSAAFFILAVISTIIFTSVNFRKGNTLSEKSTSVMDGACIPTMVQKGATVPSMQNVVPLGAQIPAMQQVVQPVATQPSSPAPTSSPLSNAGK